MSASAVSCPSFISPCHAAMGDKAKDHHEEDESTEETPLQIVHFFTGQSGIFFYDEVLKVDSVLGEIESSNLIK